MRNEYDEWDGSEEVCNVFIKEMLSNNQHFQSKFCHMELQHRVRYITNMHTQENERKLHRKCSNYVACP